MATKTKQRAPQTHADHQVNHLRKQVAGHIRIISELQEALRIERWRVIEAEANEKGAMMAGRIMETIARAAVAELPEDRRGEWLARFPGLETKEKENGTDTTRRIDGRRRDHT